MEVEEYIDIVKKTPKPKNTKWNENGKLCLLYIECRDLEIIPYNLYNICNVYGGTDASLTIAFSQVNRDKIIDVTKGWEGVNYLQISKDESSIKMYNLLFTRSSFWKLFEEHEYVLINQWDSYIFRPIPEKFFKYDYVGGSCGHKYVVRNNQVLNICGNNCKCGNCKRKEGEFEILKSDQVYHMLNGGFSLRNVSAMFYLTSTKPFQGEPEDMYFVLSDITKPEIEECKEFSVDNSPYNGIPVGCHKIWVYNEDDYIKNLFKNNSPITKNE